LGGISCPSVQAREQLVTERLLFLLFLGGFGLLDACGLHEKQLFGRGICRGNGRDGSGAPAAIFVAATAAAAGFGGGGEGVRGVVVVVVVVVYVETSHTCAEGRAGTRSRAAGVDAGRRGGGGDSGGRRRRRRGAHGGCCVGGWWSWGLVLLARSRDSATIAATAVAASVQEAVQIIATGRRRWLDGIWGR